MMLLTATNPERYSMSNIYLKGKILVAFDDAQYYL